MLACWLRLKYPDTFLGAIAASAPVRAFVGMEPAYDWNTYWQVGWEILFVVSSFGFSRDFVELQPLDNYLHHSLP